MDRVSCACTYCKRNWGEGWRRLLPLDPIQPGGTGERHVSSLASTFCSLCFSVFCLWIFWCAWRSFPLLVYFASSPQAPEKESRVRGLTIVDLHQVTSPQGRWYGPKRSPCACVDCHIGFSAICNKQDTRIIILKKDKTLYYRWELFHQNIFL